MVRLVLQVSYEPPTLIRYIQQLRDGVHNFFVTFIEVLRDRPPGHDWELEPGVTCGDYLFGFLQVTDLWSLFAVLLPQVKDFQLFH